MYNHKYILHSGPKSRFHIKDQLYFQIVKVIKKNYFILFFKIRKFISYIYIYIVERNIKRILNYFMIFVLKENK